MKFRTQGIRAGIAEAAHGAGVEAALAYPAGESVFRAAVVSVSRAEALQWAEMIHLTPLERRKLPPIPVATR